MYDVIVIGAGVVGGFVARQLLHTKLKVALLEKNNDVCCEVTKANTAIVHPGYSAKTNTIKGKMTIDANENFQQICSELQVQFKRIGSLMIATGEKGIEKIQKKYTIGTQNGVKGLRLLNREETFALEPNVNPEVIMSLHAPSTGVVNPWEYGIAAVENAVDNGAELYLNTKVEGIDKEKDVFVIQTNTGKFKAKYVINCAGLYSDEVNEMVAHPFFKIVPRRGEYYILDTEAGNLVEHIIFQTREDDTKGVIIAPTVEGNILVGPTAEDIDEKNNSSTSLGKLDLIKRVASKSVTNVPFHLVIRSFAGIRPRPNWIKKNAVTGEIEFYEDNVKDFIIGEAKECNNFFNVAGIKSPGLTCAHEIGKYVAKLVVSKMEKPLENENFNPNRKKKIRFNELDMGEQKRLIQQDRTYGNMVCRCKKITEAEIVDAIKRNAGARTVDGVKRRAGTSLGRCQGSFCTEEIIEILARELKKPIHQIEKDKSGSFIVTDSVK
ncbi:MAG: NAD(P)/FAD-dependent oxidoreductase [Clostridia bacterium]|nr:NAD(P)/FAD-dependent oxidoreductase [Clostridia bacterium]